MNDRELDDNGSEMIEESLRQIFNAMPTPVVYARLDGTFLYMGQEFSRLFGYTDDDISNKEDWWLLAFPDKQYREEVRNSWREEIESALLENRKPRPQEWIVTCKDGSTKNIEFLTAIIGDRILIVFNDVTQRKRSEEQSGFTQYVVDNMSDFAYWITPDGRFAYVNKAVTEHLGYTKDELLKMTVSDVNPDHFPEVWKSHWEELRKNKKLYFETNLQAKDGHMVPVEMTANYVEFSGKEYNCAFVRDITERKKAEEELRLTQYVVENMRDGTQWIRPDASFFYVNRAACDDLGYTKGELLQMTVHDIDPNYPKCVWKLFWEHVRDIEMLTMETVHIAKDGHLIPVEITANLLEYEQMEFLCAFVRDITERKQIDEELRRTQYVVENMLDSTHWVRPDASFIYVNKAACDLLGYTKEELLQMKVHDIDPNFPASVWEQTWEEVRSRKTWVLDSVQIAKDGHLIPVEIMASVLDYGGEEFMCTLIRNMTERKRAEAALRESEERLRLAMSAANQGIYDLDLHTGAGETSPEHAMMLGYDPMDFHETYEKWLGRIHPEDQKRVDDAFRAYIRGETPEYRVESRQMTSSGEWKWIYSTGTIIEWDAEHNPIRMVGVNTDITERKRAEEELLREKALTDAILDSMPGTLYLIDERWHFARWNKKFEDIWFFSPEEIPHKSVLDIPWTGDSKTRVEATMQQILTTGYAEVDASYLTKEGVERIYHFTGVRLDIDNKPYIVGVGIDTTERKRAEEALILSEQKFRGLIESSIDAIVVHDTDGKLTYVSPGSFRTLGYELDEYLGHNILETAHPDDIPKTKALLVESTNNPGVPIYESLRLRHKNGEYRICEGYTTNMLDVPGVRGFVGNFRDITESKRAEEELALTNEELRTINNLISATAGIADLQSILDMAADEALKISGLEGSTVCLTKPDGALQMEAHRAVSDETIAQIQTRTIMVGECLCGVCAKTGKPLILSTKQEVLEYAALESTRGEDIRFHAAFPLMVESACVGVLCVFTRTEKRPSERNLKLLETVSKQLAIAVERAKLFEEVKRSAQELEQRVSDRTIQLENANKELEAFSYSVSHDLRAPLRAIDGFSLVILEDYSDKIDEEGKGYLNRIRTAAVKMGTLIDDILRLSRVSRAEMSMTKVNLSEIVSSIASNLMESQPERKVDFAVEPDLVADADVNLIRVVLENMIGNAWKFTSKEDVARIEFGTIRINGKTTYYIRDNGVGFDQAYSDKLFGAFQRLHPESEFPGTGIGLATVKRIIYRHGGQVWAEGEVGKGATFYFTLES